MEISVKTINLTRFYGKIKALEDVNLTVYEGEIFGLLGPNGAGKTTLIRILTTLLLPSKGKAYVYGFDVEKEANKIRPIINMVAGGEEIGYGILTLEETLWLFSQFYGIPNKIAKERINYLIETFEMKNERKKRVSRLSTGYRQRMNVARGFINDPKIIFMDEPTLGLDVESAKKVREFIKSWIKEKKDRTIFLTTHNMYEAEEVCDRVAIINDGKIYGIGPPLELKSKVKRENIYEFEIKGKEKEVKFDENIKILERKKVELGREKIKILTPSFYPVEGVFEILKRSGFEIYFVKKIEPTLEEVFLELVGMSFEEAEKILRE